MRTSLLFQGCVSQVSLGYPVTYICKQPLSFLPLQVHGMHKPDPTHLKQLKFMYMSSSNELEKYLAGIHCLNVLPTFIVIDDFEFYCASESDHDRSTTKMCALLADATQFIQSKLRTPVGAVVAESKVPQNIQIFNQSGFTAWSSKDIPADPMEDEGPYSRFELVSPKETNRQLAITYKVDNGIIYMKKLLESVT